MNDRSAVDKMIEWEDDCDPSGGLCIVQWDDGEYGIDKQYMGEWGYEGNVIRWAYYDQETFNKIMKAALENEPA